MTKRVKQAEYKPWAEARIKKLRESIVYFENLSKTQIATIQKLRQDNKALVADMQFQFQRVQQLNAALTAANEQEKETQAAYKELRKENRMLIGILRAVK